tara:strand:+ start:1610 stop:1858 length:249 start_codon:yes stop_codon:yes gene_type:complete
MAKAKKITKKELEVVNEQQMKMNGMLRSLGVLDVQKQNIHQEILTLNTDIEATKKELEEKYGQVNIDLSDGSYTLIESKDAK